MNLIISARKDAPRNMKEIKFLFDWTKPLEGLFKILKEKELIPNTAILYKGYVIYEYQSLRHNRFAVDVGATTIVCDNLENIKKLIDNYK